MTLRGIVTAMAGGALMALLGACAREGAPPGGPPDRRPPVLVKTVPDTFAVVHDFDGPVKFLFDERISERPSRGTLDDAVLVSPRTGDVRVSHDRQGISVRIAGGFRPDLTYRITLLPVLSDLFNNRMRDPVELVFSTGAPFNKSAVAGLVWNRVTGEGVSSAFVEMRADSDSLVYTAQADSAGVYAFRYLPAGPYRFDAFDDQNGNEKPDISELQGVREVRIGPADTVIFNDSILRPDTTPARLTDASALDSMTVVVQFDDYLDPDAPTDSIALRLTRADSSEGPRVARLFQEATYGAWAGQVRDSLFRLDSLRRAQELAAAEARMAADTAEARVAADTGKAGAEAVAAADTSKTSALAAAPVRTGPPSLPGTSGAPSGRARGGASGGSPAVGPDGRPLPARRIVARLAQPLAPADTMTVTVSGVVNINEVPDGGGRRVFALSPPDTSRARPAPADTGRAVRADTSTAAPVLPRGRRQRQ